MVLPSVVGALLCAGAAGLWRIARGGSRPTPVWTCVVCGILGGVAFGPDVLGNLHPRLFEALTVGNSDVQAQIDADTDEFHRAVVRLEQSGVTSTEISRYRAVNTLLLSRAESSIVERDLALVRHRMRAGAAVAGAGMVCIGYVLSRVLIASLTSTQMARRSFRCVSVGIAFGFVGWVALAITRDHATDFLRPSLHGIYSSRPLMVPCGSAVGLFGLGLALGITSLRSDTPQQPLPLLCAESAAIACAMSRVNITLVASHISATIALSLCVSIIAAVAAAWMLRRFEVLYAGGAAALVACGVCVYSLLIETSVFELRSFGRDFFRRHEPVVGPPAGMAEGSGRSTFYRLDSDDLLQHRVADRMGIAASLSLGLAAFGAGWQMFHARYRVANPTVANTGL